MFDISKFLLPKIERMDMFSPRNRPLRDSNFAKTWPLPAGEIGLLLLFCRENSYLAAVSFGFEGGIVS